MSLVRKPAPDFKAHAFYNSDFVDISMSDYKGKYVLLFFYPLDFTFVCPTEIIAFNNRLKNSRKSDVKFLLAQLTLSFHIWNTP